MAEETPNTSDSATQGRRLELLLDVPLDLSVELGRARGLALGLLRPITLFTFPTVRLQELSRRAKAFVVVELSAGQLRDDVRLALEGRRPVEFYSRVGGNVPSAEEVLVFLEQKFAACEEEALVNG